jgi:hypothetical protein
MGFWIALQNERGEELQAVSDEKREVERLLSKLPDEGFPFARTIDAYGDTTFNKLQAPRLRRELRELAEAADSHAAVLRAIDELLRECEEQVHLYVKFYGD